MVMEHLLGTMVTSIRENSKKIISKVLVIMPGLMEDNMRAPGKTTRCMEEAFSLGQMAENMRVNMSMIRKRAVGSLAGLMEEHTKEVGRTANRMAKEPTGTNKEYRKTVFG